MKTSFLCSALALTCLVAQLSADVVINELSGRSPERLLKYSTDGQPSLGQGTAWFESDFNDASWTTGTAPFGYGYGDISTDVSPQIQGAVPSFYLRKTFTATSGQASSGTILRLEAEYDDGFIAYINGVEVARRNMGPPQMFLYADQPAFVAGTTSGAPETVTLSSAASLLTSGDNVLAIHVANRDISSSIKFDTTLRLGSGGAQLVTTDSTWEYTDGRLEPSGGVFEPAFVGSTPALSVAWGQLGFDDSSWDSGAGPIGYDNGNDYTLGTNLISEMRNITPSVYMRKEFNVTAGQLSAAAAIQFTIDYDDGYIIYLNGNEVTRGTMGTAGTFVPYTATATSGHNASTDGGGNNPGQIVTLTLNKNVLVTGTNILSAQLHNSSSGSSDLVLDATLATTGGSPTTLFTSTGNWTYFVGLSEPSAPPGPVPAAPSAEFTDWIELHNNGASPVNLTGWTMSDDSGNPGKWAIPAGTSIAAGGYLVVLADEQTNTGINTTYLHANFKLSGGGEYLGLFNDSGVVQDQFSPGFPNQLDFHSYGTNPGGAGHGYLTTPTPGAANTGTFFTAEVAKPDFDVLGGFHASAVTLNITSATAGATIRYTTDGSEPTATSPAYSSALTLAPINSRTGHVIRARGFATGMVPSKTKSASFLINQSSNIRQAPALTITADEGRSLYSPFGIMTIEGGQYVNNQWQAVDHDDYNMAMERGRPVERPVFLEYYFADTTTGFREDAGIRYSASGYSRPRAILDFLNESPWRSQPQEKSSFNIFFRNEYEDESVTLPMHGPDYPVDTFEQLRPRAGKNEIQDPFIRDEVMRRMYLDTGQIGSRGVFNSLYVNGEWKGYYNTCERLREPFFQAHHGGGQWDIRQAGNPSNGLAEGDNLAWDDLNTRLQASNVNDQAAWDYALELVDPIAMADYFLVNIYGATWDWPQNNWVTARQRSTEGRFRFYMWDAEGAFGLYNNKPKTHNVIQTDLLAQSDTTSRLFQRLERWPEFKLIMADRIQKHFFNGGALDTSNPATSRAKQIVDDCVDEFEPLNMERGQGTVNLSFWNNWVANPSRRSYLLGGSATHFRDAGYWPVTEPPSFGQHGGDVPTGYQLAIAKSGGGTIYYTLDGSDPRDFGGATSATAQTYSSAPTLVNAFTVAKARVLNGGEWSALTEAEFKVAAVPPTSSNLVVAEFLYNPMDASATELNAGFTDKDDFEFIQLLNTSAQAVDLGEVDFTAGISFDFGASTIQAIDPGAYVILVNNLAAFQLRYGNAYDAMIAGEYGGQLSNGGERVLLSGPGAATIHDFTYDDTTPWPANADGYGVSLKLANPLSNPDHALAESWIATVQFGGTPAGITRTVDYDDWREYFFTAAQLADPQISGPGADPDADGLPNLLEYAIGALPGIFDGEASGPQATIRESAGQDWFELSVRVLGHLTDMQLQVEVSGDLAAWSSASADVQEILPPVDNGDGTITRTFRDQMTIPNGVRRYGRVRVSVP